MAYSLSSQNAFQYLVKLGFCQPDDQAQVQIKQIPAKNFNLLVSISEDHYWLIKQEPYDRQGKQTSEFLKEWRIHQFVKQFPDLQDFKRFLPEILYFDQERAILVCSYLAQYRDLMDFYLTAKIFPSAIAARIGTLLARIHHRTFERQDYRDFLANKAIENNIHDSSKLSHHITSLIQGLERITPEIYSEIPAEGLKFFALYQRYDSLGKAIAELGCTFKPCCLTHNDLKLNNILIADNWEHHLQDSPDGANILRFIDWERSTWGDPAFDLGLLIASYLQLWLQSIVTSKVIAIEESLRLATTPLEILQPSLKALIVNYFAQFPDIVECYPNFLPRVMQFSGLALIQAIQAMIQHQKSFGNMGICMLQVAKTLLCRPEISIPTLLGLEESAFAHSSVSI